jgi:mRNA interferase HicA
LFIVKAMKSNQFKAWLKKRGRAFETKRGTGHLIVRLGDKKSELPMHGGNKELGKGLVEKIEGDLGLK